MPDSQRLATPQEEELLGRLSSRIATRLGLDIPPKRWGTLRKALQGFGRETGCAALAQCALRLLDPQVSEEELLALASRVAVGETYFFRDPELLAVLESLVLAPLVQKRRGRNQCLHILSAGCSTGEEPYTLAILLRRLLPDPAGWKIGILGVDLNRRALDTARAGVYSAWSFRRNAGAPSGVSFTPEPGRRWKVRPELRAMVSFAHLNLAGDAYPSARNHTAGMDLVLCRNVLMYFLPEVAEAVLGRLCDCLVPGGHLVLGPSEVVLAKIPGLEPTGHVGILVKSDSRPASVAARPAPAPADETSPAPPDRATAIPPPPVPPAPARAEARPAPKESARAHYLAGRYERAAAEAEATVRTASPEEDARWARAVHILVRSLANLKEYARADQAVRQAIARSKFDPHLRYLRASILLEEDPQLGPAEARAELRRALYLDRRFVPAHFLLGKLAREEGREAAARKHFANARAVVGTLDKDQVLEGGEGMTAGGMASLLDTIAPRRGKP